MCLSIDSAFDLQSRCFSVHLTVFLLYRLCACWRLWLPTWVGGHIPLKRIHLTKSVDAGLGRQHGEAIDLDLYCLVIELYNCDDGARRRSVCCVNKL